MRARLSSVLVKRTTLAGSLILLTLLLLLLGIIAVYNASVVDAYNAFGNKYYFAIQQAKWAALGLLSLFVMSRLPPQIFHRLASPAFLISLLLLLLVLIPGIGTKVLGARRWINLAGFNLQPSELAKLALVLYLSSWLDKPKPLFSFVAVLAVVLGLVMLQPDLGTAIVIALTSLTLYFISGAPLLQLGLLIAGGGLTGLLLILTSSYRRARLFTFLDPTKDPLGSSYHINQILIAIGSGGLTGVGLGLSRQKYQYLPEATTDSIFAIIAEETGLLGALIIIGLLFALILIGLRIAASSKLRHHQLLATGVTSWLAAQVFLNLAAMVALVPLTGIPLPLISYGGSSLITVLTGIGILLSIARYERL